MVELVPLQESIVDESEIDALGHLNMRNYIYRGHDANNELLKRSGIVKHRHASLYSRFLIEQSVNAKLQTFGGFIDRDGGADLSAYYEIRNADNNALAAMMIIGSDVESGVVEDSLRIDLPEYASPRSISLESPESVPMDLVKTHTEHLQDPVGGLLRPELSVVIHPDDCDDAGYLQDRIDVIMMTFDRIASRNTEKPAQPKILRDANGKRYGWAMTESRTFMFERPAIGDRIVVFSGEIAYTQKMRHSRRWVFNEDTGSLIAINEGVNVCLDLEARRSRTIPEEIMTVIERDCLIALA